MSTTNYFNPNGMNPPSPTDGLSGWNYIEDKQRYREMAYLQKLLTEAEAKRKQEELQTYIKDEPVRGAKRKADASRFSLEDSVNNAALGIPGYGKTMAYGTMGDAQVRQAKGVEALGTVDSSVDLANSNNRRSEMINGLERVRIAGAQSPMLGQAAYQEFLETLPSSIKASFPPVYSPDAIAQTMGVIINTPEHGRKMDEALETTRRAFGVADRNRDARLGAAELSRSNKNKTLMQQIQAAKTPDMVYVLGNMALSDPEMAEYHPQIVAAMQAAMARLSQKDSTKLLDLKDPTAPPASNAAKIKDILERGANPAVKPPAKRHTMQELRDAWPGKSDKQLRDAYKKKFGIDPL